MADKLFLLFFEDKPDCLPLREREMSNHMSWLERHENSILGAGSMRDPVDDKPVGGMWIIKAPDVAAVEALYQTDPFWVAGLRQSVKIRRWSKAFNRERLI